MSLEVDIQTAYEAQEAAETTARDLESRIRKIHGAAHLLPKLLNQASPISYCHLNSHD
tara:strand:+ start:566 stop:739 length:174 start_codon:yes stop_codon:yes gene_type:complete